MIWHVVEIWLMLLVAFVVGCGLGATLYLAIARGPLAERQGRVADALGDAVDAVKVRLGLAPEWRPDYAERVQRSAYAVEHAPTDSAVAIASAEPQFLGEPVPVSDEEEEEAAFLDDWDLEEPADGWPDAPKVLGPPKPLAQDSNAISISAEPRDDNAATPELSAMRPIGLPAPRNGVPDALQRIRGVGQRNEHLLNELGIFHFSQIAAWTPAEVRWVSERMAFPERIDRDDWIEQATILAAGGETVYSKAAVDGGEGDGPPEDNRDEG